jgi:hypothetical protein
MGVTPPNVATNRASKRRADLGMRERVLPSPTGRPRDDERSDLSPHDEPAVGILPPLEDVFQTSLADEITARGGINAPDGGQRRPVFCSHSVA